MKKRVLFFDSWKGGIHHFLDIVPELKSNDIEPLLVHLGSWGNEPNWKKEEIIDDLLVRDISYYGTIDLSKILEIEKPDLVLFLSTHTFAHRAMLRYARQEQIATLLMYHGFIRVQDVDLKDKKGAYEVKYLGYLKFVFKRLPNFITKNLPSYFLSLKKTKATKREYRILIRTLYEMLFEPSRLTINVVEDGRPDKCLIYAEPDRYHARSTYLLPDENIISVGNPDLIAFGVKESSIGIGIERQNVDLEFNNVMYIDTALFKTGLVIENFNEYEEYLIRTYQQLFAQGKYLMLKPHPETARMNLDRLKAAGIKIVDNNAFIEELSKCCAAITEPSTVGVIPALLGLPLFLVKFDKLKSMRYGDVLKDYPRAKILESLDKFENSLKSTWNDDNTEKVENWINDHSGPIPAELRPSRVVKEIKKSMKIES